MTFAKGILLFFGATITFQVHGQTLQDWGKYEPIKEAAIERIAQHPKVEGFWHWTFGARKGRPLDYALFNYDGTPTINGQIWIDLMKGFFLTEETLTTNAKGEASLSGYYGTYLVEAQVEGRTLKGSFELLPDVNSPILEVNLIDASK